MNMKYLILFSLFVYVSLSALCAVNYNSCNNCQADGCDYCDETGFGFFSCKDKGTCTGANVNITEDGKCAAMCGDFKTCAKCQTEGKDIGCSACSISGIISCNAGACGAGFTPVETCPKVCEDVPAANTGNMCNYPAGYKIPANESFSTIFKSCRENALGYAEPSNATANCTDKCTLEQSKLSSDCLDAVLKYTCSAVCPSCNEDFTLLGFLDYFPCTSICDDIHTKCNSQLSDECKLNFTSSCSSAATCNPGTGITGNKVGGNECGGDETSSTNAGSSNAGSSDAGSSNAGSSDAGSSNAGSSNAGSSTAASSSKTSASSTTSGSASIVACVILAVVALLI